jgi:hypothetical protein
MRVAGAPATSTQGSDEEDIEAVEDYGKLRELLSGSRAVDAYCRSALYFALTGRCKVWIVRYKDKCIVLLPHPNVRQTILVFCPFVSSASELAEQVEKLCKCQKFLSLFERNKIFLARVPAFIAANLFSELKVTRCDLEEVDEERLDWVFPSYDVELQRLLSPQGGALKAYKKKLRKFCDQNIEVLRPGSFSRQDLLKIVNKVNKGWIRAKLKSRNSYQILRIPRRELMACYRTLANLNSDLSFAMDGLILKRGEDYLAFSFWESPTIGKTVPCLAALPVSHETGLSEYLYYRVAEQLVKEGYSEMCIGGSETASLDQFKKKLAPSRAHKLRTIRLSLKASKSAPTLFVVK